MADQKLESCSEDYPGCFFVKGRVRLNECGAQNFGYDSRSRRTGTIKHIEPVNDSLHSAMADSAMIELKDGRRIPARYLELVCC